MAAAPEHTPETVDDVRNALAAHDYLADEGLATAIFLAKTLHRPLLLEGEAGVGKTEVAKVLARWTGGDLLRLQCYEGLDVAQAVYEWDYSRQLLHLRAAEAAGQVGPDATTDALEDELYSERFLVRRPLLQAIDHGEGPPPVLLIDEVDRADDEFEAFLLEVLSDYAITVPELGTFRAHVPPLVVITSNRTRDVHDALKRRCLYHWVDHPDFEREVAIVRLRAPGVSETLARQVAAAVESVRGLGLYKPPGVAETIDWAMALAALGRTSLDERSVRATLGTVLKYREDAERVQTHGIGDLVRAAAARSVTPMPATVDVERFAVGFARVLRGAGLDVPVGTVVTYAEALAAVGIEGRSGVYWAGRTTLVRRVEDVPLYNRAFRAWWLAWHDDGTRIEMPPDEITLLLDDEDEPDAEPEPEGDALDEREVITVRFSPHEVLRHKDFALYDRAELDEARRLMADLRLAGAPAAVTSLPAFAPSEGPSRPPSYGALRAPVRRRARPP